MRILILSDRIPPEERGGAGRIAWSLATSLHNAGHDIHVASTTMQSSFEETRQHIRTTHLQSTIRKNLRGYFSVANPQVISGLRKIMRDFRPDVVHAHNLSLGLSFFSLAIAHNMRIPTIFTAHDAMSVTYGKFRYNISLETSCDASILNYRLTPFFNLQSARLRFNPLRNLAIKMILEHATNLRIAVSDSLRQVLEINNLPRFHSFTYPEAV